MLAAFHYIMKEQKVTPNPKTGDLLKGSELTASCRAASLLTPWVFIAEQASASVMGICIGSSTVPLRKLVCSVQMHLGRAAGFFQKYPLL